MIDLKILASLSDLCGKIKDTIGDTNLERIYSDDVW